MKTIKFRAWDKQASQIMTVDMLRLIGSKTYQQIGLILNGKESLRNVKEVILMQFTGLLDKNGKEIYEGDIVALFKGTQVSEVRWSEEGLWEVKATHSSEQIGEYWGLLGNYNDTIEVIGNIYENPELLTENQEATC